MCASLGLVSSGTSGDPTARRAATAHTINLRAAGADYDNHDGWTSLFDGATLKGWDGNPEVWSVADGAITAVSTADRRVGSTGVIWQGGEVADFELKLEVKLEGDIHSGVAYRSAIDLNRAAGRAAQPATAPRRGPADPCRPFRAIRGGRSTGPGSTTTTTG